MIHANALTEWKQRMQWRDTLQAEQDLLICRCLVAIFGDDFLAEQLAFRGGTALHMQGYLNGYLLKTHA